MHQLINEVERLRHRVAELEKSEIEHKQVEKTLKESEEKYRQLVSSTTDAIMVFDAETRQFIEVNKACEDLYGYSREEFLRLKHKDITVEPKKSEESFTKLIEGKLKRIPIRYHGKKDGTIFPVEISTSTFMQKGRWVFCGIVRDITQRKESEDEIKKKSEQLRTLYEIGKKITSIISKEVLLPWIAKQASKLLNADTCNYRIREGDYLMRGGGTKEGMEVMKKERIKIGESVSGWIAKEKKPLIIPDNYFNDPKLIPEHREIAKKYGFRSALGVPMCIKGKVIGVLIVISKKPRRFLRADIELLSAFADQAAIALENARLFGDLEKAKEKIEESEKNLKKFSGKILSIREDEKKKLARDLHDEFGSMEFAINSKLSIVKKAIKDNKLKEVDKNIQRIKTILGEASIVFKKMAADLRPIDLDIIGLPNALKEYFSKFTKRTKIKIDFKMDIKEKKLKDDVAIVLYRVAQEALNNVNKHASAKKVKIRLYSDKKNIRFTLSDDGKGFDLEKELQQKGKLLKMGIMGMRERVESLGGIFLMKSAPEKGTEISINLTN